MGLNFWEAMKALEEGKKVRAISWSKGQYIKLSSSKTLITEEGYDYFDAYFFGDLVDCYWEIVEEPELYWQWRDNSGSISAFYRADQIEGQEKHAGPWIKTENGFKKADNWEQF